MKIVAKEADSAYAGIKAPVKEVYTMSQDTAGCLPPIISPLTVTNILLGIIILLLLVIIFILLVCD